MHLRWPVFRSTATRLSAVEVVAGPVAAVFINGPAFRRAGKRVQVPDRRDLRPHTLLPVHSMSRFPMFPLPYSLGLGIVLSARSVCRLDVVCAHEPLGWLLYVVAETLSHR